MVNNHAHLQEWFQYAAIRSGIFLAAQTYDFKPNKRSLSATDFNRSIQVILRNRMNVVESNDNESKRHCFIGWFKNGTAIHDAIEKTWLDPELRT